jgi:uncharacterized membrane protein YkvA (DUF1232 family)
MGPDEEQFLDFYQSFRKKIRDSLGDRAKSEKILDKASSQIVEYLAALPDLFHLAVRLVFDTKIPAQSKGALLAALVYVVSPIDLIPDAIPVAGWVDDLVAMTLALSAFFDTEDEYAKAVVKRHWAGDGDLFDLIRHILDVAEEAVKFLPKQVLSLLKTMFPKGPKGKK